MRHHSTYEGLEEALEVIKAARAKVAALGFEASTVDIHAVPRPLFDRLPTPEKGFRYGSNDPFWAKTYGGVNVFCEESPVAQESGPDHAEERMVSLAHLQSLGLALEAEVVK